MKRFSVLLFILFVILVIGVVIFLRRKNKPKMQPSQKMRGLQANGLVDIKIDSKKYPYVKGIKNLEPNSPVYLHFNDYTIFFKANENGELYFSPAHPTIPFACMFYVDLNMSLTEKSAQTHKFILDDMKYECKPINDIQILAGNGETRTMRTVTGGSGEEKNSFVQLL
jgi:hypothetical protein